jgi:hypothetical protein
MPTSYSWSLSSGSSTPISSSPYYIDLVVSSVPVLDLGGVSNESEEDLIRKHLSPAFSGSNWDALIAALATGDSYRRTTTQQLYQQLFRSTASGSYLDRKMADYGVVRPDGVGISDAVFRQYGIKLGSGKLVIQQITAMLEIFYGSAAVRAYVDSAAETFALTNGATLNFIFDRNEAYSITFSSSNFTQIGAAQSIEVVGAINYTLQSLGSKGFAAVNVDSATGKKTVRLYSGSLGLASSVQVVGGTAQTALQFSKKLGLYSAGF